MRPFYLVMAQVLSTSGAAVALDERARETARRAARREEFAELRYVAAPALVPEN